MISRDEVQFVVAQKRTNWSGASLACFALAIYIAGMATGGFLEQYVVGPHRGTTYECRRWTFRQGRIMISRDEVQFVVIQKDTRQFIRAASEEEIRLYTDAPNTIFLSRWGMEISDGSHLVISIPTVPPVWKTMDTAPTCEGELILRAKNDAGWPIFVVAHYMRGGHCIEDHPPIDEGWYSDNGGYVINRVKSPTHWMPLPVFVVGLSVAVTNERKVTR